MKKVKIPKKLKAYLEGAATLLDISGDSYELPEFKRRRSSTKKRKERYDERMAKIFKKMFG